MMVLKSHASHTHLIIVCLFFNLMQVMNHGLEHIGEYSVVSVTWIM